MRKAAQILGIFLGLFLAGDIFYSWVGFCHPQAHYIQRYRTYCAFQGPLVATSKLLWRRATKNHDLISLLGQSLSLVGFLLLTYVAIQGAKINDAFQKLMTEVASLVVENQNQISDVASRLVKLSGFSAQVNRPDTPSEDIPKEKVRQSDMRLETREAQERIGRKAEYAGANSDFSTLQDSLRLSSRRLWQYTVLGTSLTVVGIAFQMFGH